MSFGDVASYGIRFARDGFPMHPMMQEFIVKNEENYKRWPGSKKVFLPKGRPPEVLKVVGRRGGGVDEECHVGRHLPSRQLGEGLLPPVLEDLEI
jgi:hypothetical protein